MRRSTVGFPVLIACIGATLLTIPLGATSALAGVQQGSLPGGTAMLVAITAPADGDVIGTSPAEVLLTGTASIGPAASVGDTTIVYVLDVSGSTDRSRGCGGDQNGNGDVDFILDCEIAAMKALNQQAIVSGVDEVALVVFASSSATADIGPADGDQVLTSPATDANGSGGPDIEEVLGSAFSVQGGSGGLDQFSSKNVGNGTNFEAAVMSACSVVQQSTNPNNLVVFLSDGIAAGGGNALDDLPCGPTGAVFETFAVGSVSSCADTGGGRGSLEQIAEATGGTCTSRVTDVSRLPDAVGAVLGSRLTRLSLSIDGNPPIDLSASALPALPVSGPASVAYGTTLPVLAAGVHQLCVTAVGADGAGGGSLTDCHGVTVASPPDTTPPQVGCTPTVNPSGKNQPKAGSNAKSGQNPDGFYVLTALDVVDADPEIMLTDTGSSAAFGPFRSGTRIKLTQAPGVTPSQMTGPDVIDWLIKVNGDALVTATDAARNVSASVICLVPRPPK